MSSHRTNLVANLSGRLFSLVSAIAFLPFYLELLGPEAYGLVGFYATLLSVVAVTDMGLTATLNREMARLRVSASWAAMRDTLRTLETIYVVLVGVLTVLLLLSAVAIGTRWVNAATLDSQTTIRAIRLMSLAGALHLLSSIYQGGLAGLQRQVLLNGIQVAIGLSRGVGAILVLIVLEGSVEAFFTWQVAVNLLHFLWLRAATWRELSAVGSRPQVRRSVIRSIWRYAAGMLTMTVTGMLLMQADKVVLSKLLPLELLGYYSIAWTIAQMPSGVLSASLQTTFFPRLTHLAELRDSQEFARTYHLCTQIVAALVLPAAAVVVLNPREVLWVWLQQDVVADKTAGVLRLLAVGGALNAMTTMPYTAQLAYGWTRLSVILNTVAVLFFVPGTTLLVNWFGLDGAGGAWVGLNSFYIIVILLFMYRRILIGEAAHWLGRSIFLPSMAAFGSVGALKMLVDVPVGRLQVLLVLLLSWLLAQVATAAVLPALPRLVLSSFSPRASLGWIRGSDGPASRDG